MEQRQANAADQAYAYVRERVISGDFAAGMRLTEWQIADALGTSRTPVREAMRRLVGDGILRFQPNHGTFVGSYTAKEIGEQLNLSRERIRQIEAQALAKLKRMQRCQKLRSYLNRLPARQRARGSSGRIDTRQAAACVLPLCRRQRAAG